MADTGVFTVTIEGIAAGGAGLARAGGKRLFVEGAAPGETLVCTLLEDRRSWARAGVVEIIEASPCRVQPRCALYGVCGGCNLQHLDYDSQIAAKTAILGEAFARIGGFAAPEVRTFPSSPWEYRNRFKFHAAAGGASFGLKSRKSDEVVPVADCPVAAAGIREFLRNAPRRESAAAALGMGSFTVYARDGLFLNEAGTRRGKTAILGREIALDAGVFFQSNGAMLEPLIGDLLELAASADRGRAMADIYCGVGTFAAFLGGLFPRVDLVEENPAALALARENCKPCPGGINAAEFFAVNDVKWAANAARLRRGKGQRGAERHGGAKKEPYGFAVVDPPRQGLAPELARYLAAEGPPLLAYVSCDPATLARDSAVLCGGAYELAELRFYDFYPQTAHIESLAVFRR